MRFGRLAILILSAVPAGCLLPRPQQHTADIGTCAISDQPPAAESQLFLSLRLVRCRPAMEFENLRAPEPIYGATLGGHSTRYTEQAWLSAFKARSSNADPILFIHGYNTSQTTALDRARKVEALTRGSRLVVALTWPSYAKMMPYTWDEANNEWARAHLHAVVAKLAEDRRLTLVAHSMGNRIALDLVAALNAEPRAQKGIASVVMAAPDVDRESLDSLLRTAPFLAVPITIYGSTRDQALSASWRAHGYPRAGDLSDWVTGQRRAYPYWRMDKVEVIDTSFVGRGVVGHDSFVTAPEVEADLCRVLIGAPTQPGRDALQQGANHYKLHKGLADDACGRHVRLFDQKRAGPAAAKENGGRGKD